MIDFPDSPSANDLFTSGDKTWRYTGSAWVVVGAQARAVSWQDITSKPSLASSPHASTHATGGADVLTPAAIGAVASSTTGLTGATALSNVVMVTQAGYNAIGTPSATTLYIIVG